MHIEDFGRNKDYGLPEEHSKLLLHVIEGLNRTVELKELLLKCMNATSIVMESEASSLMLIDEQTGDLNVSIPTGPVQDDIKGIAIPKNKGIAGWVLKNNQPYYTNDVSESEHFWKDLSRDFQTRNIICVPLKDSDDNPFGVIQAINRKNDEAFSEDDVTVFEALAMHMSIAIERAKKYEKMLSKLNDREIQLTEIHHRLKNNLSTISALIELDMDGLEEEKSKTALKATGSRLRSVSDVHSLLYDHSNLGELELSGYLESIIANVKRVFTEPGKNISVTADMEQVKLDANKSMITGLIVNELLINAYQHAFKGKNEGEIRLELKKLNSNRLRIRLSDDGVGLNITQEINGSKPHGSFIVRALANKLHGELEIDDGVEKGACFNLEFDV